MKEEISDISVSDQKKENHGSLEHPVAVSHINLRSLHMGYVRWHWHEELEIDIVTKGSVEYMIGEESLLLKTGEAIYINQNIMHSIHPVENEEGELDTIVFHPSIFFGYNQTYLNAKYVTPVIGNACLRYFTIAGSHPHCTEMTALLGEVVNAMDGAAYGHELIIKSCLGRLWVYMLEEFAFSAPEKKEALSLSEARAKDAMIFIEKHYHEPLTLDEIATAIHVSKSECCRCFKKALHATPFEYLMNYRIFMASVKIRQDVNQQMSFSELATSVGFNNISYFNKVFKHHLGCTPSEYRRNNTHKIGGDLPAHTDS